MVGNQFYFNVTKEIKLCLNFVNFEKVFDAVHQEGLWVVIDGLPHKIRTVVQELQLHC